MRRQNYKSVVITSLLFISSSVFAMDVLSTRGNNDLDKVSQVPAIYPLKPDRPPEQRQYRQQPPVIPHRIRGYKINLRNNKCLTCHSWKNAVHSGATKISLTHFKDRDGNELASVSPRRYFCTQCHVTQKDAKPLVENTFMPVEDLGH